MVVAAYKENLDWLNTMPMKTRIYAKHPSNAKNAECLLTNVGRCDHTYVYHIIQNYHTLKDVTVFVTGSTNEIPGKKNVLENIILPRLGSNFDCIGETGLLEKNFQVDSWQATGKSNQTQQRSDFVLSKLRPFDKWFHHHFGQNTNLPRTVVYKGVFAASKKAIQRVPLHVWHALLSDLSVGENVEVGHYCERLWYWLLTDYQSST